ncbi:hypothetical protein DPMN_165747 [Dreissena polymorpha]|uniref:Uncharacterized protein n=1 Tax=Dreissena polymorpha TaxID=45954 RepID=A0A9D4EXF9_DREPO|nr:hypothetical protein DPMN_165747 [Dreissena polymorpha]
MEEKKCLTHDALTTFMVESCMIINFRPVFAISPDLDDPVVLTPAMLLTMKRETIPCA